MLSIFLRSHYALTVVIVVVVIIVVGAIVAVRLVAVVRLGHGVRALAEHAGVEIERARRGAHGLRGGRAADELDAREDADAAWQQHGVALQLHVAFLTTLRARLVPIVRRLTHRLVVDVVEQAVLGYEQRVRLERSFETTVRLDPLLALALLLAELAPLLDLVVAVRLDDVPDVLLRVRLLV